jgi:DNA-binding transcriptional LysR family regulator
VGFESIRIVTGPNHPLADKAIVRTQDLEGETILLSNTDCSYRRSFQRMLEKKNVHPRTILEFNSLAAIRQCVMHAIGVTVLPEMSIAHDISRGRLVALPWEEDVLEVALLMIWYKDRWVSPTLRAFMETAREVLDAIKTDIQE